MRQGIASHSRIWGLLLLSSMQAALAAGAPATEAVDTTKICLATFNAQLAGLTTEGRTFTAWALTSNLDPHAALTQLKQSIAQQSDLKVLAEDYHGAEGTLTVAMVNADRVLDGGFLLGGPDRRGFPFTVEVDGKLGAISFITRVNADQNSISDEKVRFVACSLIAAATGGPLPPVPPKPRDPNSRPGLLEAFKNSAKVLRKREAERLETASTAMNALFERALSSGKSVVIIPTVSLGHKYSNYPGAKADALIDFAFDEGSTLIWQNKEDPKSLLKVGIDVSMNLTGLHGYVSAFDAGKSFYMYYIVNPGTYSLLGNTYELRRTTMPKMSARQWSAKPVLGQTALSAKTEGEYYQTQAWRDAQFGTRTVDDGSYCDMLISGGGTVGCGHMSSMSHTETVMTDPGGWQTMTHKMQVAAITGATTLTKSFASFTVPAGEAIMVDGFYADPHNTDINTDACRQQADNLVGCAMKKYSLFRITAQLDVLHNVQTPAEFPGLRKIVATTAYRPTTVTAAAEEETPGTFEAGWAHLYSLSDR